MRRGVFALVLLALLCAGHSAAPRAGAVFELAKGAAAPVRALRYSPDGGTLASGSADGVVRLWDPSSGRLLANLVTPSGSVRALAFSPGGRWLASCGDDGVTVLWDLGGGTTRKYPLPSARAARCLAFSHEGTLLLVGTADGTVDAWDVPARKAVRSWSVHRRAVSALTLSPGGRYLVAGCGGGAAAVIDLFGPGGAEGAISGTTGGVRCASFSPAGLLVAVGDDAGSIALCDFLSGNLLTSLKGHRGAVVGVAFPPGGRCLFSAGSDGSLAAWDVTSWERVRYSPHDAAAGCLAVSPAGRYLCLGCEDGSVRMEDALTGRHLATFAGFRDREWASYTPCGVFDCSIEGARHVWLCTGEGRYCLDQYEERLRSEDRAGTGLSTPDASDGPLIVPAPPVVRILSPSEGAQVQAESVELRLEIRDSLAMREVRVFVNGRPVSHGAGAGRTAHVPLQPGKNRIEVAALNEALVRSALSAVTIVRTAPGAHRPRRLLVAAVGISDYGSRKLDLFWAADDARAIADRLLAAKGSLFTDVKAHVLLDAGATAEKIMEAMRTINRDATRDDCVIIFLAGHGLKDDKSEFYFLAHGGDPDDLPSTALPWRRFQEALAGLKAANVLLLLDACHSSDVLRPGTEFLPNEKLGEGVAKKAGVVVLVACSGNEYAAELPESGHGAFTQALLEGLAGGAFPQDGRITVLGAELYVSRAVPRLTDDMQHPMILLKERFVDFPISVVK